jgi:histidine ammonia-lyase
VRTRVAFLAQDRFLAHDIEAMRAWALGDAWPAPIASMLPSHAAAALASRPGATP